MNINRRFAIVRHDVAAATLAPATSLEGASWELFRMLLYVAEQGSIRQASLHARVDHATVRSRIDQLQSLMGVPLIKAPSPNQIELTEDALRLVQVARQMRDLVEGTKRLPHADLIAGNFVSISVSEGIGAFWLIPQLTKLLGADPAMHIAVSTIDHSFQGVPTENEIVIQLDRPLPRADLFVERVGTLHVLPAAAPSYIALHGTPKSVADLNDHRFVWQYGDVAERASLRALLDFDFLRKKATFLTQSSVAHYMAIADGCGIGLLPSYAHAIAPGALEWLNLGGRIRRDIFMTSQHSTVANAAVTKAMDWVRQAFDVKRFPWFAEEFLPPSQFPKNCSFDADLVIRRGQR